MDFILTNWFLIAVVLASGSMLFFPAFRGAGGGIAPSEVVRLVNQEKAVIVDVCQPAEFAAGHPIGAKNVPLAELESKLVNAVKNKTLPVVLTCQSGMRSGRAVSIAKKLGYEKAYSMAGGLKAWRDANLPVEKA